VRERLRVYLDKTAPLVEYYDERGALRSVDGVGSVEAVSARILEAIG
jgi:adenylate kinase